MSKAHLDSFIAASARDPFTARLIVDTGHEWGPNAVRTLAPLKPACTVLRFGDLANRPIDWPDLLRDEPERLSLRHEPFSLRPHQQSAFDDVIDGFKEHDRGKLIMARGTGSAFAQCFCLCPATSPSGDRYSSYTSSGTLVYMYMVSMHSAQRYVVLCARYRIVLRTVFFHLKAE